MIVDPLDGSELCQWGLTALQPAMEGLQGLHIFYTPPWVCDAFTVTLIHALEGIQDGTRNSIASPRLVDLSCVAQRQVRNDI